MTEDRSLDGFDADEAPSAGDATRETDGDATTENGTADETEAETETSGSVGGGGDADAASATGTYRWTPGGEPCADCGDAVERRWRDGEAYVCADCKEW